MSKKWMPITAGTLTIIGGLLFFVLVWFWAYWPLFITAIFAVIGGVHAWERKKWPLALAGSISALFTLLPISIAMFSSSNEWFWILALIGPAAVVLTVLSKKEFR